MKKSALSLITLYQRFLSFDQGLITKVFPQYTFRACRYFPSCSEYVYQAIEKYGILVGVAKGARRISRCHFLAKGGLDPLD